ncbi:hypothetical protein [Pseudarthrobacter oxydans]|uniref:hypothetical protein n=1 Tax=Pseudarthrobacter oxydans TaxID=1671 RepID=UPI0035E9F08E|nr:hypothetical protein GCM10017547_31780 [Pseudarthrobacter oxydans]
MAGNHQAAETGQRPCLMCGRLDEPTVEHIVPQTLWKRFGLDPDDDDLARFRTDLCSRHNKATSDLHRRTEMMDLIAVGAPVTRKTLEHLGDWAVWVTLLLSLARGSGVLGAEASRESLLRRFDAGSAGGPPKGVRVYAAQIDDSVERTEPDITPYVLALQGDPRVVLNDSGQPVGLNARTGPINASEPIRLGKVALLVVGSTHKSGDDHDARLDEAAAQVRLERIRPLGQSLPALKPTQISMANIGRLFTVIPEGADHSLMPKVLQKLHAWDEVSDADDML